MIDSFHPAVFSALTIVRTTPEFTPNSVIRSFSLFTVTREGTDGARFSLVHESFDVKALRADIIAQIIDGIPRDGTLLFETPQLPINYFDDFLCKGIEPPPADVQLIQRVRKKLEVMPIQVEEDRLMVTARSMGFQLPHPAGLTFDLAQKAPMRSQALWLAYLRQFCSEREHVDLFAAWNAWHAIKEARPIRF